MKIYFAPLEGITDSIYRAAHREFFPGADKYFVPFISPTNGSGLTNRERKSVVNSGEMASFTVPQILTRDADSFLSAVRMLREDFGFDEVNLNLGCPSGTVTGKGKGSALLRDTVFLKSFLDTVFASPEATNISVKTRIGFDSASEWPAVWEVLRAYPFSEITVHARTRNEFYKGSTHPEALDLCRGSAFSVIYNGDLFRPQDAFETATAYPHISGVMIGRGAISNPSLISVLKGGAAADAQTLERFHDTLLMRYLADRPADAVLGRMREIMSYMSTCFENSKKPFKRMLKSRSVSDYQDAAHELFRDCPMKREPYFDSLPGSSTPVI